MEATTLTLNTGRQVTLALAFDAVVAHLNDSPVIQALTTCGRKFSVRASLVDAIEEAGEVAADKPAFGFAQAL